MRATVDGPAPARLYWLAMTKTKPTDSVSQLARELRRLIGRLEEGARLPTVRQLMREHGVSQHLVQSALQQLRDEGAIASFVGRGTFVGSGAIAPARPRSVLTLRHQSPYERGDRIVEVLHRELIRKGHNSLLLTYYDHQHAMTLLRGGVRYDACVLQPRSSIISVELLALLRQVSDCVVIESYAAENLNVDAVSNDPARCVDLALDHLRGLGHERIAWVTEGTGNYFFRACARFFESARKWAGHGPETMPLIEAPASADGAGITDLPAVVDALFRRRARDVPTALVVASFAGATAIAETLDARAIAVPDALSVIKVGTPDVHSDHGGRFAIVGRPTTQAAATVLRRIEWRWQHPEAPYGSVYDTPLLAPAHSTARPSRA